MFCLCALKALVSCREYSRQRKARKTKLKRRKEEIEGKSVADSTQDGAKFAKLGLRLGKFAELAQTKVEEGTFGAKLGLRWGKGAEVALKKLEECTFEASCDGGAPGHRTWRQTLGPSWSQEGVKRAKLEPRWRQVGAKKGQRERRAGLRSDLETKSLILQLVVFHWEYVYLLDVGAAMWRQVGI